jgi:hypothetical protein
VKDGWLHIMASKSVLALLDTRIGTIPNRLGL